MTTYSQEELDRAVAAATAEANAKVTTLEAAAAGSQVEAKVAEAVAAKDAEITELNDKLEGAQVALAAEQQKLVAMEAAIQEEATKAAAETERTARLETRKAEIDALGIKLPWEGDALLAKLEVWSTLSDADWGAKLDEYKEIAGKVTARPPASAGGSGLTGAREIADLHSRQGGNGTSARDVGNTLRELASAGIDPRVIH